MKNIAFLFIGALMISACSSEPEKVHLRTEKGPRTTASKVTPNSQMTVEIEGMTCEMGCGGSIRKELKGTGGVSRVQFDFEEGRKKQTAIISFDSNKVTENEMITIITKMNDKQFSVGKHSSESLEISSESHPVSSNGEEKSTVDLEESRIQLPNLINILKDLIVG